MPAHAILDQARFSVASILSARLAGRPTADQQTLNAVAVLTGAADPARAERLAPRAHESAALVERLAIWALHRADDEAVATATRILTDEPGTGTTGPTVGRRGRPEPVGEVSPPVGESSRRVGLPANAA